MARQASRTTSSVNVGQNERKASTIGGAALLLFALLRPKSMRALLAPIGANMLFRGITGRSWLYKLLGRNTAVHDKNAAISVPHQQGIHMNESITIDRPIEDVYAFWRDLSNLPIFMKHLKSVTLESGNRSHWQVDGPAGTNIEWDAEIVNEVPGEVIGWRSLDNPFVDHAGSVRFAPSNGGTRITVELEYAPVGGKLGQAVARLFGETPRQQIKEDLRRLKQHLEAADMSNG